VYKEVDALTKEYAGRIAEQEVDAAVLPFNQRSLELDI